MRNWMAIVAAASIGALAGCGDGMEQVTGKVTFATGEPLAGGRIEFRLDAQPSLTARSYLGDDGSYALGVSTPGGGAPAGKYKVLVGGPLPKGDRDKMRTIPPTIDPKYADFSTSGLEYEVIAGKENVFDVVVERPQKR